MKTIGLLGGMSWESTVSYYKAINEGVKSRLGGLHSANIILNSVDFQEIESLQSNGKWDEAGKILSDAAKKIEIAGADFVFICCNTMHIVAPQIEKVINIPLVHIADATADVIKFTGYRKVGLIGTNVTMTQSFYKDRLSEKHGIETIVPNNGNREIVNKVIYDELCLGKIKDSSRKEYIRIISDLHNNGAEAVILGCTEIALLVKQDYTSVPLFDTAKIHAENAVTMALK